MSNIHGKHVHSFKTWWNLIRGIVTSAKTASIPEVFEIIDVATLKCWFFYIDWLQIKQYWLTNGVKIDDDGRWGVLFTPVGRVFSWWNGAIAAAPSCLHSVLPTCLSSRLMRIHRYRRIPGPDSIRINLRNHQDTHIHFLEYPIPLSSVRPSDRRKKI